MLYSRYGFLSPVTSKKINTISFYIRSQKELKDTRE
jgi:hypothetical protein